MWKFGEKPMKKWISRLARHNLVTTDPWNKPREKHMLEFKSMTSWISWVFRNSSQVASDSWNSLVDCFLSVNFLILYQHYINPHYPQIVRRRRSIHKELLREKILAKHLRVRDCLPTILYIISLKFSFTLTSPSTHPW